MKVQLTNINHSKHLQDSAMLVHFASTVIIMSKKLLLPKLYSAAAILR